MRRGPDLGQSSSSTEVRYPLEKVSTGSFHRLPTLPQLGAGASILEGGGLARNHCICDRPAGGEEGSYLREEYSRQTVLAWQVCGIVWMSYDWSCTWARAPRNEARESSGLTGRACWLPGLSSQCLVSREVTWSDLGLRDPPYCCKGTRRDMGAREGAKRPIKRQLQ